MVGLLANDQCQLSNRAAVWWQMFSWQQLATGLRDLRSGLETPMPNASPLLKTSANKLNKHPGPLLTPLQLTLETVGLSGLLLQQLPGQLKHPNLASSLSSWGPPGLPSLPPHSRISSSFLKRGEKAFKQAIYHSRHNLSKRNKNSPCLRQTAKARV